MHSCRFIRLRTCHIVRRLACATSTGFVWMLAFAAPGGHLHAQRDAIRMVDFKNFTYVAPECLVEEGTPITIKGGMFERAIDSRYTEVFEVREVAYGDLTGDGQDDAAVITACNSGGSRVATEAVVFTLKNGKPERLTTIEGGDRAAGESSARRNSSNAGRSSRSQTAR